MILWLATNCIERTSSFFPSTLYANISPDKTCLFIKEIKLEQGSQAIKLLILRAPDYSAYHSEIGGESHDLHLLSPHMGVE